MTLSRRGFLKTGGLATLGTVTAMYLQPPESFAQGNIIDPDLHLLNRITWGARPEDFQYIKTIGYDAYLEEQLNPHNIDNSDISELRQISPILEMNRHDLYRMDGYRVYKAMVTGMILRATYSKAQLLERMVDFWVDHFNVAGDDIYADMVILQRDFLRKHALGNFHDLVLKTAKAPAMLVYLDNEVNIAKHPNENYARELLELHTLGVDGGYTEADVKNVARALTGWTIHERTRDGFWFNEEEHDYDAKTILGHQMPAGRGIEDGLHVISIVATHPSTAQFLSRKLCVRFVSDNPPQSLINSTAQVWMQTGGEIQPVMRHILTSDEFLQSTGQKFRRPLEFFIGALRATGTQFVDYWQLFEVLERLAQIPYGWLPPNGYPDVAGAWINSSGLLARWNVADLLTNQAYSTQDTTLTTTLHTKIGNPTNVGELVDAVSTQVFGMALPQANRQPFIEFASNGQGAETPVTVQLRASKLAPLYSLMLSSPHYQWR